METTVPSHATVEAQVNAPRQTTLWNEEGRAIQVLESEADYWLAHGFARQSVDPNALLRELQLTLKSAEKAVDAWVKDVLEHKEIDPHHEAALATAEMAMRDAGAVWTRLHQGLLTGYPMKQGEHVEEGGHDAG